MSSVFEEKNISKAILKVSLISTLGQLTILIYNKIKLKSMTPIS